MIDFRETLAPRNRGILLDLTVLVANLILMRFLVKLSLNLVDQAEKDVLAKIAIGMFFAGVFFLQPLGPILKRWSFHQRYESFDLEKTESAGCLIAGYMFFYIIIMIVVSGTASIMLSETLFERSSDWSQVGVVFVLGGVVMSFVNAGIIYRFFLKPKKAPQWKFLTTPQSELVGDACMFLNVLCFQILWSCITASPGFWESLKAPSPGKSPGLVGLIFLRLFTVSCLALLVYFPPRIFYLVIDRHRKITWLTMLLANLPLILGVVLFSPAAGARSWSASENAASVTRTIPGKPSVSISAEELYKEYQRDSLAGANKYSGKYVSVTGSVHAVDLKEGTPLGSDMRLDAGGRFQWVYCRFDDHQRAAMRSLKENQMVTLQGVGEKFWVGGPWLEHCILVNAQ